MELLKRSKTCTSITLAIFRQYKNLFRGAALTSGFPHVLLFIFLVLAGKVLSILQYILSRGQRCPCHFLCQRSWMTCGKDINQGRLIYVPANI